jgi:signal transduction histidine kinase
MKVGKPHIILIAIWLMFIFPSELIAFDNIDSLKQEINAQKSDSGLYKIYYRITNEYMNTELDSAMLYSQLSEKMARQLKDAKKLGKAITNTGIIYIMMNNSDKAYECFSEALKLYKSIDDHELIGASLNNLGIYYNQMNQLPASLAHYLDALNYFKLSGNVRKQALACNNIGIIYYDQKEYANALRYYLEALNMLTEINDDEGIAIASNNVGNVYFQHKNYDTAMLFYKQAYNSEIKRQSLYGIAHELNKIGEVYFKLSEYQVALDTLSKSMKLRREINSESGICETSMVIGEVYFELNELEVAEKYYLEAYNLAVKINSEFWINAASSKLAIIYEKKQLYYEALKFHKIFKSTSDSLLEAQNIKESTQIAMKYEFKQQQLADSLLHNAAISRQKKILNIFLIIIGVVILLSIFIYSRYHNKKKMNILLEQKNKLISEHEEQLKEAIAAKDKFFSIIAHDLKSPFNAFLGLTELINDNTFSLSNEEIHQISQSLRRSAVNLFRLLENLLDWSLIQRGLLRFKPESFLMLPKITESLLTVIESAKSKGIEISMDIPEDVVIFAYANMFGSVIRNLTSNAVKFTPKGGKIRLTSTKTIDNKIEVSIADSGIGMSAEMIDNLLQHEVRKHRKGTEGEPGTGLGLQLCMEFIEKMGGTIRAKSEIGKGSTFYFSIPCNNKPDEKENR